MSLSRIFTKTLPLVLFLLLSSLGSMRSAQASIFEEIVQYFSDAGESAYSGVSNAFGSIGDFDGWGDTGNSNDPLNPYPDVPGSDSPDYNYHYPNGSSPSERCHIRCIFDNRTSQEADNCINKICEPSGEDAE